MKNVSENLYSLSRNEKLKMMADRVDIRDKTILFVVSDQKNQDERDAFWAEILAANKEGIPVVVVSSFASQSHIDHIKEACSNLKIYDDIALISFNSGSTGKQKAIQVTNRNVIYSAHNRKKNYGWGEKIIAADFIDPCF